ncbi:hypothetical protein GWN42_21075 [candidate division KSB1 bacterium]|nr:hypothetical protein [Phycisphaerae bacterium]NIV95213.1 hypothetical protein [candidate division KSB1 bacterium]
MNLKFWTDLIEVIGFVAIVASLIFVGIELRQSRAIAIGDGNLSNAEIQIETNNAINEYSAVWIGGNKGEALSEEDTVIFNNLVRNKAIHAFMEYARLDQVEFDEAAEAINAEFSIFLFENPGARRIWLQQEGFIQEHFEVPVSKQSWKSSVQANLARLDRDAAK